MQLHLLLGLVVGLLVTGVYAVTTARRPGGSRIVYSVTLAICSILLLVGLIQLLGGNTPTTLILPLGLPWSGAHFRLDALAAGFLVVINLGGAGASLFGLGYGQHEPAPERVLPFFPAFLAGMNLVLLADDAYTFLFAWESMSLASWALVMTHYREPANARAGYIYLVMASFGTFSLLLAFGLLASSGNDYSFATIRTGMATPALSALVLAAGAVRGPVARSRLGTFMHRWPPPSMR